MTGAPRILDFGVARLIDPDRHTRSGQTIRGIRPLTPNYASPEQLAGGPLTTSTDIYSLGVVLYESLTGSVPFDHSDFPWMQISERIAEEAPALPAAATNSGARFKFLELPVEGRRQPQIFENSRAHLGGDPADRVHGQVDATDHRGHALVKFAAGFGTAGAMLRRQGFQIEFQHREHLAEFVVDFP